MAAKASGRSYAEMIGAIVDLAMARYLNAGLSNGAAPALEPRSLHQAAPFAIGCICL